VTKRCLRCQRPTEHGSLCPDCQRTRRGTNNGWRWTEIKGYVRRRDQTCVQCGSSEDLQVHHRVPLAEGGSNTLSNLELRCKNCQIDNSVWITAP
jgi:5-methylcytosine-specific restriction endonuclease McrA